MIELKIEINKNLYVVVIVYSGKQRRITVKVDLVLIQQPLPYTDRRKRKNLTMCHNNFAHSIQMAA